MESSFQNRQSIHLKRNAAICQPVEASGGDHQLLKESLCPSLWLCFSFRFLGATGLDFPIFCHLNKKLCTVIAITITNYLQERDCDCGIDASKEVSD